MTDYNYLKIIFSNRQEPDRPDQARGISQEPRARGISQEPDQSQEPSQRHKPRAKSQTDQTRGNITLYHYTNIDIKDFIKPDYYGLNFYTSNDKNITNVKRAFYYTRPEPEHLLRSSKFLYTVIYPKFRLYDISQDIKGYLKDKTISEALYKIKQDYNGVIYRIGNIEIVNLFYRARIIKKERL